MMELNELKIEHLVLGLHEHNMRCAICRDKHAVFTSPEMIFLPCWDCQKKGWKTVQLTGWLGKILDWLTNPF